MMKSFLILILLVSFPLPVEGQGQSRFIPPPLRIYIPFEAAWNGMMKTLENKDHEIARQDRAQGAVVTGFREYISGPLTEDYINKIGESPKLIDGQWIRARYQYEIFVELIQEKETMVTVDANVQALERKFLGGENWVKIPTNGTLEERLLTEFGQQLFGQTFTLEKSRSGFWDRGPVRLPGSEERPRVPGPDIP